MALAFKWSASGYRLQATREDEVAARSLGIGVMRERLLAFALSGVLCGVGGALAVHQSGVLTPTTFYFAATVTTLTMLVVGGARSVFGAVLGTLAVAAVNEVLRGVEDGAERVRAGLDRRDAGPGGDRPRPDPAGDDDRDAGRAERRPRGGRAALVRAAALREPRRHGRGGCGGRARRRSARASGGACAPRGSRLPSAACRC